MKSKQITAFIFGLLLLNACGTKNPGSSLDSNQRMWSEDENNLIVEKLGETLPYPGQNIRLLEIDH